ncbi:MAG TPA: neutral/alkaline non-lysosomal ceramidase N-terminal domain-containing protein [Pirellulales bacterium]|nr:neutral/alkaline non-lysosomal ceramidase N-terminal domain-containing protein [Pirellulales bacterium]
MPTKFVSRLLLFFAFLLMNWGALRAAETLKVGFAATDVTPDVNGPNPVWIAGYGQNRRATGVHDPLFARAVVFNDGQKKIALVAVDVVGIQYPTTQEIRKRLSGFDYVLVASTHNHEGPDVLGLWGPSPFKSGVDPAYLQRIVDRTVEAVQKADAAAKPATGAYGTADDPTLLRDSREPHVPDGVIRTVKLLNTDGKPAGLIVDWSCHPEALGSDNKLITADFPWQTVKRLEEKYHCPVVYFSGAVGGLMTTPSNRYRDSRNIPDATFEYAEAYGNEVADLAIKAIDSAQPLKLAPLAFAAKPISVPLENPLYRMAQMAGVLKRDGHAWSGDFEVFGGPIKGAAGEIAAGLSEVAYLRFGQLHIAGIPGEMYPELVYGKCQEPADPSADFPDAPLEKSVTKLLPGDKFLLIGLANDELGYIIPKRQWDYTPPFAYGRKKSQYGEENSCGPMMAGVLMGALEHRVNELAPAGK